MAFVEDFSLKKTVFPFSRGKNRISQGVENRGSLISVPLALRVVANFRSLQEKAALIFFSLLCREKQGKPPKKARIISLCRTPKIPGKEEENTQKRKESPCNGKSKEIQKSKDWKTSRGGHFYFMFAVLQALFHRRMSLSLLRHAKP